MSFFVSVEYMKKARTILVRALATGLPVRAGFHPHAVIWPSVANAFFLVFFSFPFTGHTLPRDDVDRSGDRLDEEGRRCDVIDRGVHRIPHRIPHLRAGREEERNIRSSVMVMMVRICHCNARGNYHPKNCGDYRKNTVNPHGSLLCK